MFVCIVIAMETPASIASHSFKSICCYHTPFSCLIGREFNVGPSFDVFALNLFCCFNITIHCVHIFFLLCIKRSLLEM